MVSTYLKLVDTIVHRGQERIKTGLPRAYDGEPAVKTIWLGLQRVMDFAAGIRFMRAQRRRGLVCNGMRL